MPVAKIVLKIRQITTVHDITALG